MEKKIQFKVIDGLMHVRMANPEDEELAWDNDIGGPSTEPTFFGYEFDGGKQVYMTAAVTKSISLKQINAILAVM